MSIKDMAMPPITASRALSCPDATKTFFCRTEIAPGRSLLHEHPGATSIQHKKFFLASEQDTILLAVITSTAKVLAEILVMM